MTAFYNDNNMHNCDWLENLIEAGLIAPGVVDRRSIVDIRPEDLGGFTQCHFFAGVGVWSYALRRSGWPDDRPVWTGSCPCQPWSIAGAVHRRNRAEEDERDLWGEWWRLISAHSPSIVYGEQVATRAALRWYDRLADNFERRGYSVGAAITEASIYKEPQRRKRLYFASILDGERMEGLVESRRFGEVGQARWSGEEDMRALLESPFSAGRCWPEPLICQVDDGVAARVGRVHAYGNAINAVQAEMFIRAVMEVAQ